MVKLCVNLSVKLVAKLMAKLMAELMAKLMAWIVLGWGIARLVALHLGAGPAYNGVA